MNRDRDQITKGFLVLLAGLSISAIVLLIYGIAYSKNEFLISSTFSIYGMPVDTFAAGLLIGAVLYFTSIGLHFKPSNPFRIVLFLFPFVIYVILLGVYYDITYMYVNVNGEYRQTPYSDLWNFWEFLGDYRRSFVASDGVNEEKIWIVADTFLQWLFFLFELFAFCAGTIILIDVLNSRECCDICSRYAKKDFVEKNSFYDYWELEDYQNKIIHHMQNKDHEGVGKTHSESRPFDKNAPFSTKIKVFHCVKCMTFFVILEGFDQDLLRKKIIEKYNYKFYIPLEKIIQS